MTLHGQPDEWSETDTGHRVIYEMNPSDIPASCAERVIYELRLDVDRLNSEVMEART